MKRAQNLIIWFYKNKYLIFFFSSTTHIHMLKIRKTNPMFIFFCTSFWLASMVHKCLLFFQCWPVQAHAEFHVVQNCFCRFSFQKKFPLVHFGSFILAVWRSLNLSLLFKYLSFLLEWPAFISLNISFQK